MRIVSMVPSWTETLLLAGVDVVGRTRFCIHPEDKIKDIPIVGGTKDWDLEKIKSLKADLILLDQEENPKFMSEAGLAFHATHIASVSDMPKALLELSTIFSNTKLRELSHRWSKVLEQKYSFTEMDWGKRPTRPTKNVLYMIWKNPWMCVGQDTFAGSMLAQVGLEVPLFSVKYPKIQLNEFDPEETLLLFSSEPYPFLNKKKELEELTFPYAFVDGECFSWFGIRSLEFLESLRSV